ncbi:MAG TPA: pilus assembly protein TadG-related protein [Hyphomicrobium sp.]|nr:pilus assembly protein TadG-related protein [Hyphomicrobium sp.]
MSASLFPRSSATEASRTGREVPNRRRLAVRWRRLGSDDRGSVAVIFAFLLVTLCLFIGAAVDFGSALRAKAAMQGASDAAVLAAAIHLKTSPSDTATAETKARAVYLANREGKGFKIDGEDVRFTLTRESDGALMAEAFAEGSVPTHFTKIIHMNNFPVSSYSAARIERMNIEMALVLDVTGSMAGSKLTTLKLAAKDLIGDVIWDDQSVWKSRISLIPYSYAVNVSDLSGPIPTTATTATGKNWYLQDHCVSQRHDAQRHSDSLAAVGKVYSNTSACVVPPARRLSDNVQALSTDIDGLSAAGSTATHIGAAWGYYALSPNWANRFGHSLNPYSDRDTAKYLVIMSDGDNTIQYCQNGRPDRNSLGTGGSSSGRDTGCSSTEGADSYLRNVCSAAKGSGIEVITVGFQVSTAARNLLTQCASPNSYYNANSNAALRQAFKDIAARVNKLHLSH